MTLEITDEVLRKCGGGSSEYWFSYNDYSIKNISEFNADDKPENMGQIEYYVSLGIIPFIHIGNEEMLRAFVREKGSEKIISKLSAVKSEDFMDKFWKCYNVYPELNDGIDDFARDYIAKKLCAWCEENKIDYVLKV